MTHATDARADHRRLLALLAVAGAARLLFPGDAPFIADEPLLVDSALDALERGAWATAGLEGTRGAAYGPVPTWLYQIGLLLTSDLRWIAAGKAALVTLLTGWALSRLARSADFLTPALGAFAFLSPWLWFYARDLWDNSFAIPLAAGLLAAYVEHLRTGALRALALAGLFGALAVLTHLMTVPLVAAAALHLAWARGPELARSPRKAAGVAGVALAGGALTLPYLATLREGAATNFLLTPSPRSLLFALDGFRVLSVRGFDYVLGAWEAGGAAPVIVVVSCLSYAVGAYGVAVALSWDREGPSHRRDVARLLLLALLLFVALANGRRLADHPHYYNGVWIVFFLFWWIGMSRLAERVWMRRALAVQALTMAGFLAVTAGWLHANAGTRSLHYGPTLANQMAVAAEMNRRAVPDAPPASAHHPRLFPQALRVLRRLDARARGVAWPAAGSASGAAGETDAVVAGAPGEAAATAPGPRFEIGYADPEGTSGEIVLRPPGAPGGADAP